MDTGPAASRGETFRISGERGRVYVGTFRIPYSREISLAPPSPISFVLLPFLPPPLLLLLLLLFPLNLVARTRLRRKTRDPRYVCYSPAVCNERCWVLLLLLLAGWLADGARRCWWRLRMPRRSTNRGRADKVRGIVCWYASVSAHRRCSAWPIHVHTPTHSLAFFRYFSLSLSLVHRALSSRSASLRLRRRELPD